MSVRDTILDNFRSKLADLPSVKSVGLGAIAQDVKAEDIPFIGVIQGGETIDVEDDTNVRFRMPVGLSLYVKGTTAISMSESINNLADDVKTLIYKPIDLGTHVLDVQLKDMDLSISLTEKMAAAGIMLEVVYWSAKDAF